jgi:hypothetical protein
MPLTIAAIRNAKPKNKAVRLCDSGELYLEVSPSGGKWWRLKYRHGGELRAIGAGSRHVFPGRNPDKPISNNTMLFARYRLGFKMTGHGFRAVASTILNEAGFRADVIELAVGALRAQRRTRRLQPGAVSPRAAEDDAAMGRHGRGAGRGGSDDPSATASIGSIRPRLARRGENRVPLPGWRDPWGALDANLQQRIAVVAESGEPFAHVAVTIRGVAVGELEIPAER